MYETVILLIHRATAPLPLSAMKEAMILLFHWLAGIARLLLPGGGRTIVAEEQLTCQYPAYSSCRVNLRCSLNPAVASIWLVLVMTAVLASSGRR